MRIPEFMSEQIPHDDKEIVKSTFPKSRSEQPAQADIILPESNPGNEIRAIRSDLEQMEMQNESREQVKLKSLIKKSSPKLRYSDRLGFPSDQTSQKILNNITMPLMLTELGVAIGYVAVLGPLYQYIPPDTLTYLTNTLPAMAYGSTALLELSALGYGITKIIEKRNTTHYGKYLTVTKTASLNNETLSATFPQVSQNLFFGELHFLGQSKPDKYKNPVEVVRDGINGLFQLASACEEEDPKLKDIESFAGISPIIKPSMTRFGFEVTSPSYVPSGVWERSFGSLVDRIDNLRSVFNLKIPVPKGKSLACLITRDQLIKSKSEIAKFIH